MTQQPASQSFLDTAVNFFSSLLGRQRTPNNAPPEIDTAALQRYVDHFNQEASDNIDRLANKQITIDEWQAAMEQEIANLHLTAQTIGVGGIDNLTQDDLNHVLAVSEDQTTYLRKWADDLRQQMKDGKEINFTAMKPRARMYGQAADATLQSSTLSHVGVPELPSVPRDNSTQCLSNCLCSWRIEKLDGEGNYDCFWILGQPETVHCENCPKRAQVWNPLQIRAGSIVPFDSTGLFN